MARLGSQSNPLILNAHDEQTLNYISKVCSENDWFFIAGMNLGEPENLEDLQRKLYPPTLTRNFEKIGRNDSCPCGSGRKFKKCHWDPSDAYA